MVSSSRLGASGLQVSEISLGSWLTFGSSVDRERTAEVVQAFEDYKLRTTSAPASRLSA